MRPHHSRASCSGSSPLTSIFLSPLQKYYLIVNLCKVTTVPDLVATIASRSKITEESVIRDCKSCLAATVTGTRLLMQQ